MTFIHAVVPMLLLAAASPAAGQVPPASGVDVYQGPKGIEVTPPTYPIGERQSRAEGWVIVNFMIDQQGKPYEVSVADSTGNRVLENAAAEQAVKAIEAADRKTADGKIALLKPYNLSEDAWLGVAQYLYCRKWCTEAQQLTALRRAVADEKTPRFLPPPVFVQMLELVSQPGTKFRLTQS